MALISARVPIPHEEEKLSLDLLIFSKFNFHLVETKNEEISICNYYGVSYKFTSGYGNMNKHLERHHAAEIGIDPTQTQISRFASSSRGTSFSELLKYSDKKKRRIC